MYIPVIYLRNSCSNIFLYNMIIFCYIWILYFYILHMFGVFVFFMKKKKKRFLYLSRWTWIYENIVDPDQLAFAVPYVMGKKHYFLITVKLKKMTEIGFIDWLLSNAGQKYCRMLQLEHSAILLTFIKLLFAIQTFVLSFFKWVFKTGLTVYDFPWMCTIFIT